MGDVRAGPSGGPRREGGLEPPAVPLGSRPAPSEAQGGPAGRSRPLARGRDGHGGRRGCRARGRRRRRGPRPDEARPPTPRRGANAGRDPRTRRGGSGRGRRPAPADRRAAMSDVLLFVEHRDGAADGLSLEALTLARTLAASIGGSVRAVGVGSGAEGVLASLGSRGVSAALAAEAPALDAYSPAAWAAALGAAVDAVRPAAVVAPGSDRGNEVLAHLAARRGLPMAANVLSVDSCGAARGGAA